MRRMFTSLCLATMLTSGAAFSDDVTWSSLQSEGVTLTVEQAQEVARAEGDTLVAVIVDLVENTTNPELAITIVRAVISAHPEMADALIAAASDKPNVAATIASAALDADPAAAGPAAASSTSLGGSSTTSSIPSGSGGSGGGSASPS